MGKAIKRIVKWTLILLLVLAIVNCYPKAKEYVRDLVNMYHADGVIYEQIKFCEYWGYERALASHIMTNEYGIPSVTVDRQYTASASGQLRTRVQAFVESLEIKKIQKDKEGK